MRVLWSMVTARRARLIAAGCWGLPVTLGVTACGMLGHQTEFSRSSTGPAAPFTRALVTQDGRHVLVPVTSRDLGCFDLRLTATERPRRVVLHGQQTPSHDVCAVDAPTSKLLTAVLRRRLWGRALVDGSTGRPVRYFDGRRLVRIGHLPDGYRFHQDTPWPDLFLFRQPKGWRGPNAWVREYVPREPCSQSAMTPQVTLRVTQVRPATVAHTLGTGPARRTVSVNGHRAVIRASTAGGLTRHAITWTADGYGFGVVWLGHPAADCPHPTPVPEAELLRVARSLHH